MNISRSSLRNLAAGAGAACVLGALWAWGPGGTDVRVDREQSTSHALSGLPATSTPRAERSSPLLAHPSTSPAIQTFTWTEKREHLLRVATQSQVALDELYVEAERWRREAPMEFERAFRRETEAAQIDTTVAFFMVDVLVHSGAGLEGPLAHLLRLPPPADDGAHTHHFGAAPRERQGLVKLHALTALRGEDAQLDGELLTTLKDLVASETNLALVREGLLLLQGRGHTSNELAALVEGRPKDERFAYVDITRTP